jgi:hypothetical protein
LLAVSSDSDPSVMIWDLSRAFRGERDPSPPRNIKEAEVLWERLNGLDPTAAKPAIHALTRAPEHTLALLDRLWPAPRTATAKQVEEWIDQLDSSNFRTRENASQELQSVGPTVLPALRSALKEPKSLEQRLRIQRLVERLAASNITGPGAVPASLREMRALEVLERIGSPAARKLVERAAARFADAVLRAEARLVLTRLGDRAGP